MNTDRHRYVTVKPDWAIITATCSAGLGMIQLFATSGVIPNDENARVLQRFPPRRGDDATMRRCDDATMRRAEM